MLSVLRSPANVFIVSETELAAIRALVAPAVAGEEKRVAKPPADGHRFVPGVEYFVSTKLSDEEYVQ